LNLVAEATFGEAAVDRLLFQ